MKKIIAIMLLLIGLIIFSSCHDDNINIDIYTSIYPVEFMTKEIVKEKYSVRSVYPRGKDVHDYDISPKDIIKMSNSKIIFYIGLGLEPIIENSKDSTLSNVPCIKLSSNLTLVELNGEDTHNHSDDEDHSDDVFYDSHVWLDPSKMITMTNTILDNIIKYMNPTTEDIDYFKANADELKFKLNEIDNEFFDVVDDENIKNKTIMVDHDAYAYWEARYGIDRIKLRSNNESSDVSPAEMQEKIALAKSLGIKYICTTKNEMESPIIDQYITQLGLTSNSKVKLHHLGTITLAEEKAGFDYFSIMRDNIRILKIVFPR